MKKNILLFFIFVGLVCPQLSLAKNIVPVEGYFDLEKEEYVFMLDSEKNGSVSIRVDKSSEKEFRILVNIDHLKTALIELSSQLEGLIEIGQEENGQTPLIGKIWSQYSLVNHKPIEEFSGHFEIKNEKLFIKSVSLGGIVCRGWIDLISPHEVDLSFNITALELKDFLLFFGNSEVPARGLVSGDIQVSGKLQQFGFKGQLVSYNGLLDDLEYESFHFNFEGTHPIVNISDSQIVRDDGIIFLLQGTLDLASKENFDHQVDALTKAPIVNINGEKLEWTFKQIKKEGASSKTELKYLLKGSSPSGQSYDDEADMFAVERSIEF